MTRAMTKSAIVGAALTLLVGCAGNFPGVTLTHIDIDTPYSPDYARYATAEGELASVVYGEPFGDGQSGAELLDGVDVPTWWTDARLRTQTMTDGTPTVEKSLRLVLLFNRAVPITDRKLCEAAVPAKGPAAADGVMTLQGAFCSGEEVLSAAFARTAVADGAGNERLQALLTSLVTNIMPNRDPLEGGCEGDC